MTITETRRNRNETSAVRNLSGPKKDEPSKWRRPRRRLWVDMFGRGWVVRKPSMLGLTGTVLGSMGVVGVTWGSIQHFQPERLGIMFTVVGLILLTFQRLEQKNLAADEIYNVAHERGMDEGYEQGYADRGQEQPASPVVVPMPMQRCTECGSEKGLIAVRKSGP